MRSPTTLGFGVYLAAGLTLFWAGCGNPDTEPGAAGQPVGAATRSIAPRAGAPTPAAANSVPDGPYLLTLPPLNQAPVPTARRTTGPPGKGRPSARTTPPPARTTPPPARTGPTGPAPRPQPTAKNRPPATTLPAPQRPPTTRAAPAPPPKPANPGKYFGVGLTDIRLGAPDRNGVRLLTSYAQVCVQKLPPGTRGGRTRITWDTWSLVTNNGRVGPWYGIAGKQGSGDFPAQADLAVGQCASGRLPFAVARGWSAQQISYENTLAEIYNWKVA